MNIFVLFSLTAFCGCGLSEAELFKEVTFGVGLPRNARIIATLPALPLAQDVHAYYIFDTDQAGIEEFALRYSGVQVTEFLTDRTKLHGANGIRTWADVVHGIPWDLRKIKNGRYFRRSDTNGFLSIDMETKRVYVFR